VEIGRSRPERLHAVTTPKFDFTCQALLVRLALRLASAMRLPTFKAYHGAVNKACDAVTYANLPPAS
jgi:hypothetical protein